MSNVNDITDNFGTLYHPKSALVFYQTKGTNTYMYVEHFDMNKNGNPINAHPLTVNEAKILAKALHTDKEKDKAFLKPKGILPTNILHINPSEKGTVLWYTKAQEQQLYFVNGLGMPNGKASVPSMLWYASKNSLAVFALTTDRRP
ncbi:PRTRC system protein B, partial [Flavobacterium petrolei]